MKKLIITFALIQLGFNLFGQTLLKNHVKFTPTRILNTYRSPGFLFGYERQLNKFHSVEFNYLRLSDFLTETGDNYKVNSIKGNGIGASYRFNFWLAPLQKLLFNGSAPFQFYVNPNFLYSKGKSSLEWTFIDDNEQTYLDEFTMEQTMSEFYLLFGSKAYLDKEYRFSIEIFAGLGKNIGEIIHTGRENILHQAEVLDEWDLSVYWPQRSFNFMALKSGISFNYSF